MIGVLGGVACGLVVLAWWLFFSRAPWADRIGALVLMIVAVAVAKQIVHRSISNGMMGMMLPVYSIPVLSLALVIAVVATRHLSIGARRASLVGAVVLACGVFIMVRTDGVTGAGASDLHWRWTPTAEQRLLAQAGSLPMPPPPAPLPAPAPTVAATPAPAPTATGLTNPAIPAKTAETPLAPSPAPAPAAVMTAAEWPGFRGPARDSVVRGVRVDTDWSRTPPVELWHRPVGPGWSSFAVQGDLIYTQEQRGDDEMVSCYRLSSGQPVWAHRDRVRFYESNGGAGPRATPTLQHGRVYSFGATGVVNALDAATGRVVWSRNAATDTSKAVPGWGFAGSPLVVGDLVILAVSGQLIAYDAATGAPRWRGPARGGGYSSPHLATIDGVPQIILLSGGGATSVAPADGKELWTHAWDPGVGIVQPAVVDGDLLISGGDAMGGFGIRRLAIARGPAGWTVDARWSTRGLKPYFNDYVVHKGHAYGVDGAILSAIDLSDGTRKWKGGRYGAGQILLLADQDLLLVVSEEGELALVSATPDKFTEVARAPALEGKTWNHPVLVGDILLVRNGEEMAAFRLPIAGLR
jgi:outer membrane protein assembly factor BamB